ncbi:SCAN domain-containing protein 3 [Trichonephila clavipes]|nr:SCAN domain-containing protein 3 [Trichonephila clavipes]
MDKFLSHKRTFDDNKASTSAQTSIVPKIKSRKYSQEYLNFGFTITEVNGEKKPLCVICSKILAADNMKPNKLKRHFETLHAIEIVEKGNFAKDAVHTLISNDTVSRRIDDIAEDVEQQLFGKLRDKLFSIQLDEATYSNKDAHFIAYVRFWDGRQEGERETSDVSCSQLHLKIQIDDPASDMPVEEIFWSFRSEIKGGQTFLEKGKNRVTQICYRSHSTSKHFHIAGRVQELLNPTSYCDMSPDVSEWPPLLSCSQYAWHQV